MEIWIWLAAMKRMLSLDGDWIGGLEYYDERYDRDSLGRRNESFHSVARRDNEYVRYFFTVDLQSIMGI